MNVLLVDDHALFLEGFCLLLGKLFNPLSLDTCTSGREALALLDGKTEYDLIILDLAIPDVDGMILLKYIKKRKILAPVVFVSATENIKQIARAFYMGASGFIPKHAPSDTMMVALSDTLEGNNYAPENLIDEIRAEIKKLVRLRDKASNLTCRQLEVLQLISKGLSNREIASQLGLTENTVKSYIAIIFRTLNVSKRIECIREAESLGVI